MIQKIKGYIKKEPVLCIALLLAFVSMFWIHPDAGYVDYIDFRTLAILFCLMAVVAGMKEIGVFDWFSQKLLLHVKGMWQVILILVLLCFFLSMAITNDVALITFVPLTIIVLGQLGEEKKRRWLLPVVVMQTVAANLGSMLTPIGNPQNLYLYGLADMGFAEFVRLMFPYSLAALFLLLVWIALSVLGKRETAPITIHLPKPARVTDVRRLLMHLALFLVCLLAVAHVLHYAVPLALVLLLIGNGPKSVETGGLFFTWNLCGIFCVYRKYGAVGGVSQLSDYCHRGAGDADRCGGKPGYEQCSGGASAVRVYGSV